jgi:hypothetical protein
MIRGFEDENLNNEMTYPMSLNLLDAPGERRTANGEQ